MPDSTTQRPVISLCSQIPIFKLRDEEKDLTILQANNRDLFSRRGLIYSVSRVRAPMFTLALYRGVNKKQRLWIFLMRLHTQRKRYEVVSEDKSNSELNRRLK
jgi:hypothetical protein